MLDALLIFSRSVTSPAKVILFDVITAYVNGRRRVGVIHRFAQPFVFEGPPNLQTL
jgi:hypothetical protein